MLSLCRQALRRQPDQLGTVGGVGLDNGVPLPLKETDGSGDRLLRHTGPGRQVPERYALGGQGTHDVGADREGEGRLLLVLEGEGEQSLRQQRGEILGGRARYAADMVGTHAVGVSEHRQEQRKRGIGTAGCRPVCHHARSCAFLLSSRVRSPDTAKICRRMEELDQSKD